MKRVTVASTLGSLLFICFFILILSDNTCESCFSPSTMVMKLFVCGLVIFIGSIYFTWLYLKTEKKIFLVESLPLLETNEAVAGVPFSCEGVAVQDDDKLLVSPYTNKKCIYYHSITETQGGKKKWMIIENLVNFSSFQVRDPRGTITVDPTNLDNDFSDIEIPRTSRFVPDPDHSEIDCTPVLYRQMYVKDASLLGVKMPFQNKMRRSEYILEPNRSVFVSGYVSKKDNELVLHEHERHPLIISQRTKENYINEFYKGKNIIYFMHFLMSMGYTISVLAFHYGVGFDPVGTTFLLIGGNTVFTVSVLFTMYNRLITLLQRAKMAAHNIDVELKRRAELLPRVVRLVQEYSKYEKELQIYLARMRVHTKYVLELPKIKKMDVTPLRVLIEKYPEIKAHENYKELMLELVDTEERIAYVRAFYNRSVRKFNTLVYQFPFVLVSWLGNIKKMEYLTLASDAS